MSRHGRVESVRRRESIARRDGCVCHYCGVSAESPHELTRDHVIVKSDPRSNNAITNLVLACKACNAERGNDSYLKFASAKGVQQYVREGVMKRTLARLSPNEETAEEKTPSCKFCGSTDDGPIGSDGLMVCPDCASEARCSPNEETAEEKK